MALPQALKAVTSATRTLGDQQLPRARPQLTDRIEAAYGRLLSLLYCLSTDWYHQFVSPITVIRMDGGDTCKVEFSLGSLVATPAALRLMLRNGVDPVGLLKRHASGDWSEMEIKDQAANKLAASTGLRVFSAYWVTKTERVWVITEADRSFTTFLLPSEY